MMALSSRLTQKRTALTPKETQEFMSEVMKICEIFCLEMEN